MSLRKDTSLGSNLASVTDLKRIQTPNSLCCDFGGYKTLATRWSGGRVQFWVQFWAPTGHLAMFQKVIEGLEGKINGQALGASLRLCDGRAQTQGVSESVAVAKHATTPAILTQFKSQQGFECFVNFGPRRVTFLFMWNENFDGIGEKLLPAKAAPMASLNLSVSHWPLRKTMT